MTSNQPSRLEPPGRRHQPWTTSVLAVIAVGVALLMPAVAPNALGGLATASAGDCPDIEVIFARGTNDPPGLGHTGDTFVRQLRGKVGGRSVNVYAVNYPASMIFLTAVDGANDTVNRIQSTAAACPGTKIVLGGFSQGAAVMDLVGNVPVYGLMLGTPLSPELANSVAAVATLGDPAGRVGTSINGSPLFGYKAINICNPGDPICSEGKNMDAHHTYDTSGATDRAAGFVAGLV